MTGEGVPRVRRKFNETGNECTTEESFKTDGGHSASQTWGIKSIIESCNCLLSSVSPEDKIETSTFECV